VVAPKKILFIRQLIILFLIFASPMLFSQENHFVYSNQVWTQYYTQIQINENYAIVCDAGIRGKLNLSEKTSVLGRIGFQKKVNKNISFTMGAAWFGFYSADKLNRNEWRGWQEFSYNQFYERLNIQHRFRLEERFFHSVDSNNSTFNYRSRYRVYVKIPINNCTLTKNTFYLFCGDEIFIDFGKDVVYNFNQNRVLYGLGYKFNDRTTFSLTYVDQIARKNKGNCYERTNIIWVALTQKFAKKAKK